VVDESAATAADSAGRNSWLRRISGGLQMAVPSRSTAIRLRVECIGFGFMKATRKVCDLPWRKEHSKGRPSHFLARKRCAPSIDHPQGNAADCDCMYTDYLC
jgi:hypothetical protein